MRGLCDGKVAKGACSARSSRDMSRRWICVLYLKALTANVGNTICTQLSNYTVEDIWIALSYTSGSVFVRNRTFCENQRASVKIAFMLSYN